MSQSPPNPPSDVSAQNIQLSTSDPVPPISTNSVLSPGRSPWIRRRQSAQTDALPTAQILSNDHIPNLEDIQPISITDKEQDLATRNQRRVDAEQNELDAKSRQEWNLRMCRWYFYIGCFGLPFIHMANVLYFSNELRAGTVGDYRIRRYIYLSIIVAIVETFMVVIWIIVFQLLKDDDRLVALNILNANTSVSLV